MKGRVQHARAGFEAGKRYLAQVENLRCRLAGYAYIARFEGVLEAIEQDHYHLRATYPECQRLTGVARLLGSVIWLAFNPRHAGRLARALSAQ